MCKLQGEVAFWGCLGCVVYMVFANSSFATALNRSPSISMVKLPFCAFMKLWTIDKPRPLPPSVRESSPRLKRSVSSAGSKLRAVAEMFFSSINAYMLSADMRASR